MEGLINPGEFTCNDKTREIFLSGDICAEMQAILMRSLLYLLSLSHKEITVWLTSTGGCCVSGLAMYDIISASPAHVTVVGVGWLESMAPAILQAADRRVMLKHGYLGLHDGQFSSEGSVPLSACSNWFRKMGKEDSIIYAILLKRIRERKKRFALGKLVTMCREQQYLTAREACDLGLCDEIWETF